MVQNQEGQEQAKKLGQVVAKAWQDEGFKQRLVANPKTVLGEHGLAVPAGVTVRVVEDTADTFHLVLPPKPASGELPDDELEQVAGGERALNYLQVRYPS